MNKCKIIGFYKFDFKTCPFMLMLHLGSSSHLFKTEYNTSCRSLYI